jgi:hypothetical protein
VSAAAGLLQRKCYVREGIASTATSFGKLHSSHVENHFL